MIEMEAQPMSELPRFISMARRLGPPAFATATLPEIQASGSAALPAHDRGVPSVTASRWRRLLTSTPARSLELA